MKDKAGSNRKSISLRIKSYIDENRRFVKWASAIIILVVVLAVATLYDVDTARTPSGIITVSISGNGSTAVYNISFLSLTSTIPIDDLSLILTGNSGTYTVTGFNVGASGHYYNNATIYKTEIIASQAQPDNLSLETHILIRGNPLAQVAIVETSTNGQIASYKIT
jgi:hypothetical protein